MVIMDIMGVKILDRNIVIDFGVEDVSVLSDLMMSMVFGWMLVSLLE